MNKITFGISNKFHNIKSPQIQTRINKNRLADITLMTWEHFKDTFQPLLYYLISPKHFVLNLIKNYGIVGLYHWKFGRVQKNRLIQFKQL